MSFNKLVIYKNVISGIIAPHGMTDLFHAHQNNKINELLSINIACSSCSIILNKIHDPFILDSFFLLSSIIHFRHDMPNIFPSSNYSISLIMIMVSIFLNHDIFFIYMILCHVPHHYYMNKDIIKKNMVLNLATLIVTTIFFLCISHKFNIFESSFIFDLSKGIIISHILYEEMYIHNNNTLITFT